MYIADNGHRFLSFYIRRIKQEVIGTLMSIDIPVKMDTTLLQNLMLFLQNGTCHLHLQVLICSIMPVLWVIPFVEFNKVRFSICCIHQEVFGIKLIIAMELIVLVIGQQHILVHCMHVFYIIPQVFHLYQMIHLVLSVMVFPFA